MMTKQQEREALERIKNILADAGNLSSSSSKVPTVRDGYGDSPGL